MAYTSEQYKFMLVKLLQKYFSMQSDYDRAYTYSFFGKLFDSSVTLTESSYNQFLNAMNVQLAYCAEHNVYLCENITSTMIEEYDILLIDAFAAIGITLTLERSDMSGDATFVKPSGDTMVYHCDMSTNYFYINTGKNMEYSYAKAANYFYEQNDVEIVGLDVYGRTKAGEGTQWSYNPDTATITVTGNGSYVGVAYEEQIGAGEYTTAIIGANVTEIKTGSVKAPQTTLVLLTPIDGEIIISPKFNTNSSGCGGIAVIQPVDVYTDCLQAIEQLSQENYKSVTLHSLNEWEG